VLGGDVFWSELHGSRLYWVEERYLNSGLVESLRTLDLAAMR
jgi:hypothetical protein